jgi:serine protease Do
MIRAVVRFVAIGALLAFAGGAAAQTVLPREVRERILQAVVEVVAYDPRSDATLGSGSGTIVSPDGWVLTNFHVLDDGSGTAVPWAAIFVTDPAAPDRAPVFRFWARFEASDPERDLALVRIVEDAEENPLPADVRFVSVPVGDSGSLIPGDPITVVGYPGISGATITFTSGIVSGFLGEDLQAGGKQWIKTDAKLARGNSGGGAFDQNGVLVGVPTLARQSRDGAYLESQEYLRPIDLAWPLLSRHVAGLERVGGVAGQLGGEDDASPSSGPSPLEVAREGAGRGADAGVPPAIVPAAGTVERGALEPGDPDRKSVV